jgi:hypothetical protein
MNFILFAQKEIVFQESQVKNFEVVSIKIYLRKNILQVFN